MIGYVIHVKLKPELTWKKQHSTGKKDSFHQQIGLNLRKNLVKCYIWSTALYGAETWTLLTLDQKYLKRSEMWCWRKWRRSVGPIVWEMRKCYIQSGIKGISYIQKKEGRLNGLVTRWVRDWILKPIIEGKTEGGIKVTGIQARRSKQLLDDL